MDELEELERELDALERQWKEITVEPPEPRSTMNVIEYSLDAQRKGEVYVNRLLTYFINPEEPHGLGEEFLRAFLQNLPDEEVDEWPFDEGTYDLSKVRVRNEIPIRETTAEGEESGSFGRVDIVVDAPNEWFLLIELKFSAAETGTQFYYRADEVGEKQKSDYESGQYYLYLHDRNEPPASEPNFVSWTWRAFIEDFVTEWVQENHARYPHQTVVQLQEFIDDVQTFTNMTEHDASEREKVELYLEHVDVIDDVSSTFDDWWDAYTDEWATRLAESLGDEERCTSYATVLPDRLADSLEANEISTDVYAAVDVDESERWMFRATHSDWGMLFKEGWWIDEASQDAKYDRERGSDDIRIGFHHRMGKNSNRPVAVQEKTLVFYFRNMGANPTGFKDIFADAFADARPDLERALPENAEPTGNKEDMIAARYEIRTDEHDDFFEAYTAALHRAFMDFVVENEELVPQLDECFEESVKAYLEDDFD